LQTWDDDDDDDEFDDDDEVDAGDETTEVEAEEEEAATAGEACWGMAETPAMPTRAPAKMPDSEKRMFVFGAFFLKVLCP
jgi:hypothetical protein